MTTAACPICGREFEDPQDREPNQYGSAENRVKNHMRVHDVPRETPQGEFSTDEPPQPKASQRAAPKKSGGRRPTGKPRGGGSGTASIPLAVQLELPYKLGSNIAQARGFYQLAQVLDIQARPCAEAWDTFLMRYPALREKIEQGMIAGDVVGLIMAHVPIFQVFRMEVQARQEAQAHYEGGLATAAA